MRVLVIVGQAELAVVPGRTKSAFVPGRSGWCVETEARLRLGPCKS